MDLRHGVLLISLDFELYWGVRDKRSIEQYRDNLRGVENAVKEMLRVFGGNGIHATWATVGFLFFKNLDHLKQSLGGNSPEYTKEKLSPYRYIEEAEHLDPTYHFAPELIESIHGAKGQEIGTHTFSHYYCLEEGQTAADFRADLNSALNIARANGQSVESLVFPRNQANPEYLPLLTELGIKCYRGNEKSWLFRAPEDVAPTRLQRAVRLVDAYLNLSGHHTYSPRDCLRSEPFNFPSSRLLRPYSRRRACFERFRLKRITDAMDDAARNKRVFHLWWHPHNFGVNTRQNVEFLERIVAHYRKLERTHGMRSLNMGELASLQGAVHGKRELQNRHALRRQSVLENHV